MTKSASCEGNIVPFKRPALTALNANGYHSYMQHGDGKQAPTDRQPPSGSLNAGAPVRPTARVSSKVLLGGANELVIEHAGREYRLRVTQHGKLILTA